MRCLICNYIWETCINNHINSYYGCRSCNGKLIWTWDRFITESTKRHGNLYDYSNNNPHLGITCNSKISIICNKCNKIFSQNTYNHCINGNGCPFCNRSRGELQCISVLEKFQITFEEQFVIGPSNNRKFDFMFFYNDRKYLLEYDGQQHFLPYYRWYREEGDFENARKRDIIKTQNAIANGYVLIRIDYTQFNNIEDHIIKGINSMERLYLSTPSIYDWILDSL